MDAVVVDTDVVSFVFKRDTRESLYRQHLDGKRVCIAFMTVAELYQWALSHHWGTRRIDDLRREITRYVVLPYDDAMAWDWARIRSINGRPVESKDAWIAAAAVHRGLPLVTHNRRHFEGIPGLRVISES